MSIDEGQTVSYEDLTVEQLQEEARKRGLTVGGRKDELIERIVDFDKPYEERTVEALKEMARERGLSVGGLKEELIARLVAADEGSAQPEADAGDGSSPTDPDADVLEEDVAAGTESDEAVNDRGADRLAAWRAENPDATVIPPDLLPAEFRDGTKATPGLPPGMESE